MHTKGPWTVKPFYTPEKDDDPMMVYEIIAGDLQERYDNLPMDDEGEHDEQALTAVHEENRANAALIASAPDLLGALKDLYYFADGIRQEWEADNPNGVYNPLRVRHLMAAKQAIAKAEGKA